MPDTDIITQREAELYQAMITFNYTALDGLLSDEISYITIPGGETRLFDGVAMTTGAMEMLVGAKGSAKSTIRLQHVLIWQHEVGTWRLLLRQETRIPT